MPIDHERRAQEKLAYRAQAAQPPQSRLRAWHAGQSGSAETAENKRIVGRYIDAIEDAAHDARKENRTPTMKDIERRFEY